MPGDNGDTHGQPRSGTAQSETTQGGRPHTATCSHVRPAGTTQLLQADGRIAGSEQGCPHSRAQGGLGAPPGAECALCPQGTEGGCLARHPQTAAPLCRPASRQLPWAWPAVGADTAALVAAAPASGDEHRGRPRPVPCVGASSVLGQGWVVRAAGRRPASGPARLPSPLPQLCPLYLRHPAAAGAAFPDGPPSSPLCWAWQAAGRGGGRRWFFLLAVPTLPSGRPHLGLATPPAGPPVLSPYRGAFLLPTRCERASGTAQRRVRLPHHKECFQVVL